MEYHPDKMTKDFEIGEIDNMPPHSHKGDDSTPGYIGKTNLSSNRPDSAAKIKRDLATIHYTRFQVIPPLRSVHSPFEKFPHTIIDPLDLDRINLNKPIIPIIPHLDPEEMRRLLGIKLEDVPTQETKGYTASRRGGFGDKPRFPNKPDSQGPKDK